MGKNSSISWTDHSWNPFQGCKKVSPGCKNCYMFDGQKRWGNDPENIHRSSKQTFNLPNRLKDPCKVFVCSWSDFFLKEADEWRPEAWEIIRNNPHITFQILTKRPENMQDRLPADWPYKNVWLGVTVETQRQDWRILPLLATPAEKRFLSVEPMIGPVNLLPPWVRKLDWVICGGESGPNYRDMDIDWVAELMFDCKEFDIPFFMKQMAAVNPKKKPIPDCINIQEFPK